jgi:steroid delta-isomerase
MPTPDQMTAAVETYVKSFATADKVAWLGLFADDAEQVDPYPAPANVGGEAIEAFWDRTFSIGSDYSFDAPQLIGAGDRLAMPFTLTFTSGGGRYQFDGVDVFEFDDDGKIKRLTAYWDPAKIRPA